MRSILFLLVFLAPSISLAQSSCFETTWRYHESSVFESRQPRELDRQAAEYSCQVMSRNGQAELYLKYMEALTQKISDATIGIPWDSANDQIFKLLGRAYYVPNHDGEKELRSLVSCIGYLRTEFSVHPLNGSFSCWEAIFGNKFEPFQNCLSGAHPKNETEGKAIVYRCFTSVVGY